MAGYTEPAYEIEIFNTPPSNHYDGDPFNPIADEVCVNGNGKNHHECPFDNPEVCPLICREEGTPVLIIQPSALVKLRINPDLFDHPTLLSHMANCTRDGFGVLTTGIVIKKTNLNPSKSDRSEAGPIKPDDEIIEDWRHRTDI